MTSPHGKRFPHVVWLLLLSLCVQGRAPAFAQTVSPAALDLPQGPVPLDPVRTGATLNRPPVNHLREQFIWTAGDAAARDPHLQASVRGQNDKTAPHFFRAHFRVGAVPRAATLYLAGPRSGTVLLNGVPVLQFADDGTRPKGLTVLTADVAHALHPGDNVLAMEEVRGHSSLHTGANSTINQVTYGEVLLLKLVARPRGVDAPPLLVTDAGWRSTLQPGEGWQQPGFDDRAWPRAEPLGIPGTRSDFMQWNADAGLYAWPGYTGIGPALRTLRLPALAVRDVEGLPAGTRLAPDGGLVVDSPNGGALTVDFGRELSGRVHLVSADAVPVEVRTAYGESPFEARGGPYLGVRPVYLAPGAEAFGPKSAFRFVRLELPPGRVSLRRVEAEAIVAPFRYAGSFASSDPLLDRIWETAAYTAHLCMGEGVWDAPKRDRGQWMGDLDVTGRTIEAVFAQRTPAERAPMEETMASVIGAGPVERDINTIAGYSALWVTGQAEFFRHAGDLAYLRRMQPRLVELLRLMRSELDADGLFTNPAHHKVFVDWSPGFSADTPEARAATHFEFVQAFRDAAFLLGALHDKAGAEAARTEAGTMQRAAAKFETPAREGSAHTFGPRWQTNAAAVDADAITAPADREAIWTEVLARTARPLPTDIVTPFYGFYLLRAMSRLGHRAEALDWMRSYWGGMLRLGATSFWEAFNPAVAPASPEEDFHARLEADGKRGYYVSLAHGWASGPAAWLMEEVLGIEPTSGGFGTVTLRPSLLGLRWVRGAEPTPRGLLGVDLTATTLRVELPPATTATVVLPFDTAHGRVLLDGRPVACAAGKLPTDVVLRRPGVHRILYRPETSPCA